MHKWFVYNEFDEASKAAADFIATRIKDSIQQKGVCHVALPGGNTPAKCLAYLSDKTLQWNKVHWYLGDERCYPKGHAERNDVMLENNLWSRISKTNIHTIFAERGAEQAAADYREVISSIDYFDIVFLGMGEDGHTASLFPGNEALHDTRSVIPVYNAPKLPDERVSLSLTTLSKAQCRLVLVGGAGKSAVIAQITSGEELPINRLGDCYWFVDVAAASASNL
jgi:6-phosphogluconolactonase